MCTSITGYMAVGKTKDAGWQVGVSRTVPVKRSKVWAFLLGPGLPLWLGVDRLGSVGSRYQSDRAVGEVRSLTENVRVRVTHRPADGSTETTVQVGLREAKRGTTIVFHQERMTGPQERERAREHWKTVAEKIAASLTTGT